MSFSTETYGRYEIKSGPLAGAWAANAFRRKLLVAKTSGASKDAAVENIKEELDRLDRAALAECDAEGAPSADIYEAAFVALLPSFPDSYLAMLRAHMAAPDKLISATKLAEAAGYTGYEGANLHYGLLGQRVAEEVGFVPPRRSDGSEVWTCAVARDPSLDTEFPDTSMLEALVRSFDAQHFEWQMRPQVVQALQRLGI